MFMKRLRRSRDALTSKKWEMGAKESAMTPPPASHAAQPRRPPGRPAPRAPDPAPAWPESSARWRKQYDVYVCSSERDLPYAKDLVTYLQEQPERLRCFLPARDMNYGGAIPTELTEGAESSHCWVMLMSPEFLEEQWCHYQMLQFLTLAPFPDGRLIPVLLGLGMDKYPKELKLFYAFKSAPGERAVFGSVRMAVLTHLRKLPTIPSDQTPSDTTSSSALEGRSSSSPGVSSRREESTGDPPARNESSSDGSARSSEIRGVTNDIAMSVIKSQQESTGDPSPRCSSSVESPSDASVRSARAQRHSSERSSESQEPTNQPFMNPEALGDTAPTTVVSQWSTTTKQELISEGSRMQGSTKQELISEGSRMQGSTKQELISGGSRMQGSTKQELISGGSRMQGSTKQELISEGSRMQGSTQRELISEGSRVQGSTKQGPISEDSRMQGSTKQELISKGSRMQGSTKQELISEGSRMQGSPKRELISEGSRMQGSTKQELISEGSRVQGSPKRELISGGSRAQGSTNQELISEGSRVQGSTKQVLMSEGSRMQGSTKQELISEGSRVQGSTKRELISGGSRAQGSTNQELISEGSRVQGSTKQELMSESSRMQGSTKQELISGGSRAQGSTNQELISEGSRVQGSPKRELISGGSRAQGSTNQELISEGSRVQGSTKQELMSEGSRMQGSTKQELISEGSRVPGFTKQESILAKDFLGQETPAGSFSRSSMTQQSPSEKGSNTMSLVGSSMEKATSNTATKVFMTRQISGDTPVSSSMQRLTCRSIALGPTGDDSRSRTDLLMSNVDSLAPNTNISDVTRKTLDCRTSAGIGAGLNPFAKEAAGRSSKKLSPNLDSCCPWMDIYSSSGGAQDDNLYTSHSEIQMNEDSHPPHGDIYRSCIGMTSQSHEEPPSLQRDLYTSDGGQMEKLDIQSLRGDDMEKVLRNCRRGGYTGCPGSWAGEQPPQHLQGDLHATRGPNKMERRDALYLQGGEGTQAEDGDPLQLLEDIYASSGGTDGPDLKGGVHGGTHTVNSCRYQRDETENEASQVLGCINNTNCDGRKDFCCPHTNSMLTKVGSSRSFYTGQRGSDLGTPQSDVHTSFSGERGYEHPPLLPRDLLPGSRGGTVLDRSCSCPQRDLYTGHVGNEASGVLLGLHGPVLTANQNCHGNGHRTCAHSWEAGCTSKGAQGNVFHIYRGNADACEEPAKSFIQADKLASEAADKT